MKTVSIISARRHFMARQGLSDPVNRRVDAPALQGMIERLGFVQVDSVNVLERAHHHILYARANGYRPALLSRLIERDRLLFENWTHDASVIPTALFPYWKHRFARERIRMRQRWKTHFGAEGFDGDLERVRGRVADEGPLMASDFEGSQSGGWWNWHPSKAALEYLWRTGELCITQRVGFQKVYDLTERVIPDEHRLPDVSHESFVNWACRSALERLGFATRGEIAAFWALLTPAQVDGWLASHSSELQQVAIEVESGGARRLAWCLPGTVEAAEAAPEPPARLRVLSPFDPLLRDRARAARLFGFDYRIEIFVPEAKRRFGYYVFPVMRGESLVGRADIKADRSGDVLTLSAFWPEPGMRTGKGFVGALEAEMERLRRLAGVSATSFAADWLREPQ